MVDRPILFSTPMVQALLAGRKSQTRRLLKDRLGPAASLAQAEEMNRFAVGDRLWVREAFAYWADEESAAAAQAIEGSADPCIWCADYEAGSPCADMGGDRWRSGFHMPRWASRMTLVVSEVRIQRLHEIDEADARAEGAAAVGADPLCPSYVWAFHTLWEHLHGRGSWMHNPWVVALTFSTHNCNIDQLRADA